VLAHLLVALTAAVVTAVTVPLVARMARRAGVVQRRAEAAGRTGAAVPTLGGLGMLAGFLVAMGVAWYHPAFDPLFTATSEPLALLVGVVVIVAVGLADDLIDLPRRSSSPGRCWRRSAWPSSASSWCTSGSRGWRSSRCRATSACR
jgi:UDP-GlcNAc:undecaprenyl-phosphate/decaprenyl-phosphate GlcNAc-1-phosphate transferase